MSSFDQHNAEQDRLTARWDAAGQALYANLAVISSAGVVATWDEGGDLGFSITLLDGTVVEYDHAKSYTNFDVDLPDAEDTIEVETDIDQTDFEADIDFFEWVASDPLGAAENAVEIARNTDDE